MIPRQRIRQRTDLRLAKGPQWSVIRLSDGVQIAQGLWTDGHQLTHHDWFRDVVAGKLARQKGLRPNPCLRLSAEMIQSPLSGWNNVGANQGGRFPYGSAYLPISPEMLWNLVPSVGSSQAAILYDNSFNEFSVQMPQEVSIANFMWEARELSAMLPAIQGSLAATVSGGYLQYQFGWKPLIGDLKKLGTLSKVVADRLAWLRATYGKWTRLGYSAELSDEGPASVRLTPVGYDPWIEAEKLEYSGKFRAGTYLFHQLERLEGIEGEIRAFSAALGLTNPAAILWEAIPFSFVADWFLRIGRQLNQAAFNPFPGEWECHATTHSYTIEVKFKLVQRISSPNVVLDPIRGYGRIKRYERNVGLPVPSTLLLGQGLDTRKQLLAAALLVQAAQP